VKEIPWCQLTVGDLQKFQDDFLKKGIVRIVDGDKKTVVA
jgi:hypothetical protein